MQVGAEDNEDFSVESLELCSYRVLQQTAKRMNLPSNVKKIYLIELIHMKKHGSPDDLENLVYKVRSERKLLSQARKKTVRRRKYSHQVAEVSSTSSGRSPPICSTPRRGRRVLLRYSPGLRSPRSPLAVPRRQQRQLPGCSDRVLRSFKAVNNKTNNSMNTLMEYLRTTDENEEHLKEIEYENIPLRVKNDAWKAILLPKQRSVMTSPMTTIQKQRRLSSIYPLRDPKVTIRRSDGTLSKIKAIVQTTVNIEDSRSLLNTNIAQRAIQSRPIVPQLTYNRINNKNRLAKITIPKITYRLVPTMTASNNPSQRKNEFSVPNVDRNRGSYEFSSSNFENYNNDFNSNQNPYEVISSNFPIRSNNTKYIPTFKSNRINYELSLTNGNVNDNYRISTAIFDRNQVNREVSALQYATYEDYSVQNYRTQSNYDNLHPNRFEDNSETLQPNSNNYDSNYAVYYHKKIRAEQVRKTRDNTRELTNERLPRISDVFSKFNCVYNRDVTQPIYVQVDTEPEIMANVYSCRPPGIPPNQTSMLESLWNVKHAFLVHQPLLQICTTSNTCCTYSTPVIATAKAQPSASTDHYTCASARVNEPYYTSEETPRVQDFFKNCTGDEASTVSLKESLGSNQGTSTDTFASLELETTASIPEMVEDALELISQDGDYMERMGMDAKMQCVLCDWAGPKIMLELHIRKNHAPEIVEMSLSSFCAAYTLNTLSGRWLSQVIEHEQQLYVLSAMLDHADCFLATLYSLSFDIDTPKYASMTIYNKVTGEPFTWEDEVQPLPSEHPFETLPLGDYCLRVELGKVDLLPNSANLKLMNKELVGSSPKKVIVGQPELDNIYISLLVRLFNGE